MEQRKESPEERDSIITHFLKSYQEGVMTWPSFNFLILENAMGNHATAKVYRDLQTQDLATKHRFNCLDRVLILLRHTDKQAETKSRINFKGAFKNIEAKDGHLRGTIVGDYNNELFVNIDGDYYGIPLQLDEKEYLVVKDNSGLTNFESVVHFQNLNLGFYLVLHNEFLANNSYLTQDPNIATMLKQVVVDPIASNIFKNDIVRTFTKSVLPQEATQKIESSLKPTAKIGFWADHARNQRYLENTKLILKLLPPPAAFGEILSATLKK